MTFYDFYNFLENKNRKTLKTEYTVYSNTNQIVRLTYSLTQEKLTQLPNPT